MLTDEYLLPMSAICNRCIMGDQVFGKVSLEGFLASITNRLRCVESMKSRTAFFINISNCTVQYTPHCTLCMQSIWSTATRRVHMWSIASRHLNQFSWLMFLKPSAVARSLLATSKLCRFSQFLLSLLVHNYPFTFFTRVQDSIYFVFWQRWKDLFTAGNSGRETHQVLFSWRCLHQYCT